MINLSNISSQLLALNKGTDGDLTGLMREAVELADANGLADLTHILVIEPGDAEAHIIEAIGFTPLVSRIDGKRSQPDWDLIQEHADWWQLTYCVGDSGFAFILFVSKAAGTLPELQVLCQQSPAP